MKPEPAFTVAASAAIGNLLHGWDYAAIAGALHYLKPEFSLYEKPAMEGLLAAASLIGAWLSTLCAGPAADWLGRRSVLCFSGLLYTTSSCLMLWSPNLTVLLLARHLVGGAIGISVTIVPIYIAEIAPVEVRGQLSTFPQFLGSGGLLLSYVLCFVLSLARAPQWRRMLSLMLLPSLVFLLLGIVHLPESPRWLVSKGKMLRARKVLQKLRNRPDVTAELALLVEGLRAGANSTLQEWILDPADETSSKKSSQVVSVEDLSMMSWFAKPAPDEPQAGWSLSRHTTHEQLVSSLVDPMVTLIGSLRPAAQESMLMDNSQDADPEICSELDRSLSLGGEFDDDFLVTPLISRKSVESMADESLGPRSLSRNSSLIRSFYGSYLQNGAGAGARARTMTSETLVPSVGIGGGWQLGWQWDDHHDGSCREDCFRRVFLLQEHDHESGSSAMAMPAAGESIQAAAVVGKPAQASLKLLGDGEKIDAVGPAMLHPVETALRGPAWSELLEGGVRRALLVAVVLQIMQQFSGINAALYYIPQILQQSGATSEVIKAGLDQNSASILGGTVACLFMLPSIAVAMRLMDQSGRRRILLSTLPLLLFSLLLVVASNTILPPGIAQSAVSFVGIVLYVCIFMTGFGPIPNILASEMFPTRVRGVCIGICQLVMWSCNILLTNIFPVLLLKLGLAATFGGFAVVVSLAWVFILLKVPETKGMPLEVIIEFFAMSAAATKPLSN